MEGVPLVGAAVVLLGTLVVGTVAHELAHASVLCVLDIPYDIEWFPDRDGQPHLNGGLLGAWATVTPHVDTSAVPRRGLQLSAIAPFVLTVPVVLMGAGVLPDPLASGNVLYVTATVAWLGCALPSPQDFSLFWHPARVAESRVN